MVILPGSGGGGGGGGGKWLFLGISIKLGLCKKLSNNYTFKVRKSVKRRHTYLTFYRSEFVLML